MTVIYSDKVATSSVGCFLKLLARWRGSVYKLLWKEFMIFVILYTIINLTYRFALSVDIQRNFEVVTDYCDKHNNLIPVTFVLGFYVNMVFSKWRDQYISIPWPDRVALHVAANIQGSDERARILRRTIMRYLMVSYTMTMSSISCAVKKRFPTLPHLTEAGLLLENEEKIIENISFSYHKFFVPSVWSASLVSKAYKEGKIKDNFAVNTIITEINNFRGCLGVLFDHDRLCVPLVYTQVVTLVVYTFLFTLLIGGQVLTPKGDNPDVDMYVPWWTCIQFIAYMGWLKVAETMINPFGEDDDDFDINWILDRNIKASYMIVDGMHEEHPELVKDAYWDQHDFDIPYTEASQQHNIPPHLGSAMNICVTPHDSEFVLQSIPEGIPLLDDTGKSNPTDIPQHGYSSKHMARNDSADSRTSFFHLPAFIKRSMSKESRNTNASETPVITRRKPTGMEASGSMLTISTNNQDEMFLMEDVSMQNLAVVTETGAAGEKVDVQKHVQPVAV